MILVCQCEGVLTAYATDGGHDVIYSDSDGIVVAQCLQMREASAEVLSQIIESLIDSRKETEHGS